MNFVYVLQCEESKIYVGQTTNIVRRFEEHKNGEGSAWTKKYKALSILELVTTSLNDFREVALTLQYMLKFGISNVRGGPFSHVDLNSTDLKAIVSMMKNNAFPKQWFPMDCDKHLFEEEPTKRIRTTRCGLPWSQTEDLALYDRLVNQKLTIEDCGAAHERSMNSIKSRILVLIKASTNDEAFLKSII